MKYSEARAGRIFIVRLEQGEIIHESLEKFASDHKIMSAAVMAVGAADKGSKLIVGPKEGDERPVIPMEHLLEDPHEMTGFGTIFPDESGIPRLHMHLAAGRAGKASVGCARRGVKVWQILEVILIELIGSDPKRIFDKSTGFELLEPSPTK